MLHETTHISTQLGAVPIKSIPGNLKGERITQISNDPTIMKKFKMSSPRGVSRFNLREASVLTTGLKGEGLDFIIGNTKSRRI
jgi:hypothetical protein